MKTKQAPAVSQKSYDIVEEKVRMANEFLKKVDMNQLHQTIEKARANPLNKKAEAQQRTSAQ